METIIVKIDNPKDATLFKSLIEKLSFIQSYMVVEEPELPVTWAKKYNPSALFDLAGKNKFDLKEIRKSWQRTK